MYEDQIAKGIQLLDEKGPEDWRSKITGSLNMANPYLCVLGQVYGNYWEALDALNLKIYYTDTEVTNWAATEASVSSYGFLLNDLGVDPNNYVILANEWKAALNELSS